MSASPTAVNPARPAGSPAVVSGATKPPASDGTFAIACFIAALALNILFSCVGWQNSLREIHDARQVQTALSLVQSGLGVALVPGRMTRFVPDGVALCPLREPVGIEMGMARSSTPTPPASNFVATAIAVCDTDAISKSLK